MGTLTPESPVFLFFFSSSIRCITEATRFFIRYYPPPPPSQIYIFGEWCIEHLRWDASENNGYTSTVACVRIYVIYVICVII